MKNYMDVILISAFKKELNHKICLAFKKIASLLLYLQKHYNY